MLLALIVATSTAFVPSAPALVPRNTAAPLGVPSIAPLTLRGGARRPSPQATAAVPTSSEDYRPERALQPTAFIFVLSVSIIALAPTQHLVSTMGSEAGTKLLALVSSVSAVAEIILAPIVGAMSDSIGRKPVLLLTLASVLAVNTVAAFSPNVFFIAASRFVCNLVVGLFFLASGATLGDKYRSSPGQLAKASGTIYALVNAGFAVGIALSRYLPTTAALQWGYAVSSLAAAAAIGVAAVGVKETMPAEARVPFKLKAFNPISCVRLLSEGREMRLLAILLAITLQPIFMGDVLQVYALQEWQLSSAQLATFFTFIPVLGALGNVLGGRIANAIGVQAFTAVATLSNMLFWACCMISHQTALIGAAIGFLGPARTLGASTALTTAGARKGIPQGQLSGDRSNLIAILKVVGPAVYGFLYVRGRAAGLASLPFVFNLLLTLGALLLAPFALRGASEGEGKKA